MAITEFLKKRWKIIVPALILLLVVYLLFFTGGYKPGTVKIARLPAGLSGRVFRNMVKEDSIAFPFSASSMLVQGDSMYVASFDPDFNLVVYNIRNKAVHKPALFNTGDAGIYITAGNGYKAVLFRKNASDPGVEARSEIGLSGPGNETQFYATGIPFKFAGQVDDSNYYCVMKRTPATYLMKYNFREKRFSDSLDLCRVYATSDEHLDFILQGKIILDGPKLVYKSTFSGEGFITDKNSLLDYKKFRTLDSLPLPEFKKVEYAGGLTQFEVAPEIYAALCIKKLPAGYAVLSGFVLKGKDAVDNDSDALDFYDNGMRYKYSYLIPRLNREYLSHAFDLDTATNSIYVLYNDNKTILKFKAQ